MKVEGERRGRQRRAGPILIDELTSWVMTMVVIFLLYGCGSVRPNAADAPPTPVNADAMTKVDADEGSEGGVDPSRFTPYFSDERGGDAAKLLAAGDHAGAREAFIALTKQLPQSSVLHVRARFAAAVCAHEAGLHADALRELPLLVDELPLLADHMRYLASISAYRENEFERSAALARSVSTESPLAPDAELMLGDALRALSRHVETEAVYRGYVFRHRGGPRLAEASFKLAEAIEATFGDEPDLERVRDAIRWYRRVVYRHPRSRWARQANRRLRALAGRLPEAERAGVTSYNADEQLERAQAYARVHRHQSAMREFSKVLSLTAVDGPIGCQARLGLGRAAYNNRQREKAAEVLIAVSNECDETDVRAWALYLAARSKTARGDDAEAIRLYATLERDHETHRLADDARLRRAQAQLREGKAKVFKQLIHDFADTYPEGDMGCEAQWQLGWYTYREGDYDEALEIFRAGDEICDEPEEGAGGRELYWAGRTLQRLERPTEAIAAYRTVIEQHPLTFYMFLAAERLEALDRRVLAEVLAAIQEEDTDDSGWRFDPEALRARPAFIRGIELHRLGFGSMARTEFAHATSDLGDSTQLLWLSALLHHQIGAYTVSHWIARRDLTDWRDQYPSGGQERYWEIAYPRGFTDIVRAEAVNASIQPELIWAVMREESGFSPTVESYANAVGLLQLLPATASRFARGLRADRVGLKQPENNIPIAARYLEFLLRRNEQSPILSVGSYNAGEGAVGRWRREEPDLDLDEALESFSYSQTRRYTRRVLSSFGTYHYLYNDHRIPRLLTSGTIDLQNNRNSSGSSGSQMLDGAVGGNDGGVDGGVSSSPD